MCGQFFTGFAEEEEEDHFAGRECYSFNRSLIRSMDDEKCAHCRHYLTLQCKYIHEFMDEDGDT